MTDQELGIYGEGLAQRHLLKEGYSIRQTNYRYKKYEIGEPWMAVTKKKQRQIIQCANDYVQSRNISKEVRFDIISIVHNSYRSKLEHIVDAFST